MVKRYEPLVDGNEDDDDVCGYLSEETYGQAVMYTDYAAILARLASLDQKFMILQGSHDLLKSERDEWKRRCGSIVDILTDIGGNQYGSADEDEVRQIIAIAEGRDNG